MKKTPSEQLYYFLRSGQILFSPAVAPSGVTVRYQSVNWLVNKAAVTSNADVPVFPEHLLERSAIWRWKRQKGLPYDDILAEFEADLETAILADRGA